MKFLATLALSLGAATAFADATVMDNDKTIAVDCTKDKVVNLLGNHITATLTGTCDKVNVNGNHATVIGSANAAHVSGNENTLTLDGVDTIAVSGNSNTVSYKKPVTKPKTRITNTGKGNTITQSK